MISLSFKDHRTT